MSIFKKYCSAYVVLFLSIAQIAIGLITILLGHVTGPFLVQSGCFIMLLLLYMGNEILHRHDSSLRYIATLVAILPAIIVSETLCIHSIINITTMIELEMWKDLYPESKCNEYYENAQLAMSINAAMLYIVNGIALTYIWMNIINIWQ